MMEQALPRNCYRWTTRSCRPAGGKARILIVDDEEVIGEALCFILGDEGHDTRHVTNGLRAVEMLATWPAHIVILDISMPIHDGFTILRTLRGMTETGSMVVFAHTALPVEMIKKRLQSGHTTFDGYCQKGQSVEGLLALIGAVNHTTTE